MVIKLRQRLVILTAIWILALLITSSCLQKIHSSDHPFIGSSREKNERMILPIVSTNNNDTGYKIFVKRWLIEEGLGPLFNDSSCASCHFYPRLGGSSPNKNDFAIHIPSNNHARLGTFFPKYKISGNKIRKNKSPENAQLRRPQSLLGIGLLDEIADSIIIKNADEFDRDNDGISGRFILTNNRVGRYGWKARIATLEEFVSIALTNEMGIVNPEIDSLSLKELTRFVRNLETPTENDLEKINPDNAGFILFSEIGCTSCHIPSLQTIDDEKLMLYSDLLLHDMGNTLSEGFKDGKVEGNEFRTAPLWSINITGPPYLHNGMAKNLRQSIELHGGEAETVITAWKRISAVEKELILTFLESI